MSTTADHGMDPKRCREALRPQRRSGPPVAEWPTWTGADLRSVRKARGLTVQTVASALGAAPKAVYNVESGAAPAARLYDQMIQRQEGRT